MEQTQFTQEELDAMFSQPSSKYNTSVKITDDDRKAGVRVLCKEPYAQELYDLYSKYDGGSQFTSKDFTVGQLCSVTAKSIDFENKIAGIGPTFYPTGDIDTDIETMKDFYRPIKGKHPEKGVR